MTLGLDIVFGYTGEVSLGHAALFGIGAYTAGVLSFQLGIGFLAVAAVPASSSPRGFGAILALPALRVTGPYLAMVTLAFGTIVQILINEMTFLTNGPLGITLRQAGVLRLARLRAMTLPFFDMSLQAHAGGRISTSSSRSAWSLTLVVINRLLASPLRPRVRGAARQPDRVGLHGRLASTGTRCSPSCSAPASPGFAGVLFAYSEQYIAPNNFSFDLSIQFLLGGDAWAAASRALGPIIGAAIVVYLPNLLADIALFRIVAGVHRGWSRCSPAAARCCAAPRDRTRVAGARSRSASRFFVFSLLLQQITDYKLTDLRR